MRLRDHLEEGLVLVDLQAGNADAAIPTLTEPVVRQGVREDVRERIRSTLSAMVLLRRLERADARQA